jgi:hypothetical protein
VADTEMPEWPHDERAHQVRSPNAQEVRTLLVAAGSYDRRLACFIRLTAATGARRGELRALRWSDVDWDRDRVRIDEAVVARAGGTEVKRPKTRASVRWVAIDGDRLDELRWLRTERLAIAADCDVELDDDGFVFSTDPGALAPPHPEPMTHGFRRVRAGAGVSEDIHLHSLRHFQATELDAVISEAQKQARLGWSTVHMARHYTDAVTDEDRRAAEHMGAVLGKVTDESPPGIRRRSSVRFYAGSGRESLDAWHLAGDEPFHGPAWDPIATGHPVHGQREVSTVDGPVEGRAAPAEKDSSLLHCEKRLVLDLRNPASNHGLRLSSWFPMTSGGRTESPSTQNGRVSTAGAHVSSFDSW